MRVPKEVPLLRIAEENSYLEQQVKSLVADQFGRLAILDYGSTRPESYPDPVRHTTRSLAAVLSDIERASTERLALMRAVNSSNEGPEIRAARSARFAAQRKAECEAIKAALKPQVAPRYQPPEYSSPCIAQDAYPFLQAGPSNPSSDWQRPHLSPNNIPAHTHSTPNPYAHFTTTDPSLHNNPMETNYPAEHHQPDLYLFKDLANSLPPIHSPTQTPYAHANPSIPRRMSTSSTQSTTPTPTPSNPARALLIKHRVRRNSDQDAHAPRRGRGRPPGSKNRAKAADRREGTGPAIGGLSPSEEGGGRCVVVMDGDEYVWLG